MDIPATVMTPHGPSVEGAGPALLAELLPELGRELAGAGVPVELFEPGLEPSDIRAQFAADGYPSIPDEVVVWFQWHNGASFDGNLRTMSILPRFVPWTLDDVVEGVKHPPFPLGEDPWEWSPEWIQLLGDSNGLAVSCAQPPNVAPLIRTLNSGMGTHVDETDQQSVSLCTPVAWWIEGLRNGWYQWNPEELLWARNDVKAHPRERWVTGLL